VEGPLAVIFEDSSCYDCAEFHDSLLTNPLVLDELKAYTVVRLDTNSTTAIIDIEGNSTTAADLARKHEMTYRPGVLIFDEGLLQRRYDSLLYSYHFKEGLRYISGGYYRTEDSRSYSLRRREELLASGVDIDLAK
jgi:thioredoxin-related protein